MTATFFVGDAIEVMGKLPEKSVDLILTSPPFLALRSYLPADHPDKALEGGSQATPGAFIDWLIDVVEACDRVLAPHGSLCIELGDTYAGSGGENHLYEGSNPAGGFNGSADFGTLPTPKRIKTGWPLAKSLSLIPELFRLTLVYGTNPLTGRTTERWRLRNVVRWVRPNPPVGALGDKFRPATSELMVFCKSAKRYFDLDSVRTEGPEPRPSSRGATEFERNPEKARKGTIGMDRHPAGAPPLDWWNIPPGGYEGAHYAVFPPELCIKPIKAMSPERVCKVCGEPSRRIVDHPGIDRRPEAPDPTELAAYLKANLNGYTPKALAAALSLPETQVSHYLRTDDAGARLPDPETWERFKELLNLDDTFDAAMATVAAEYENIDYGNRAIPQRLSGGTDHPKRIPVGFSDCGHDDWRPGLVLDPFGGSGTTALVATGHGRDCILIDLDERNYDLALERVGPFILERAS